MRIFTRLQKVTFAANTSTAGQLDLSQVPAEVAGKTNYVRQINVRLSGSGTSASGNIALLGGTLAKLIKKVTITVDGIPQPLVQLRGTDLARLYRVRNKGLQCPGTAGGTNIATSATAYDFTLPIQFADPNARKADDFAIPARLLAGAQFQVDFGAGTDIDANLTTLSGTLEVTVISVPRAELVRPSIACLISEDYAAGTVQPVLARKPGKISHQCVGRSQGALFASTEQTQVGMGAGQTTLSVDTESVSASYYAAFNELATTAMVDHTAAGATAPDQSIPLLFNPNNLNGEHQTYEMVDGNQQPRYFTDTATNAYTFVYRLVLDDGPWGAAVDAKIGIPAGFPKKVKTASKKSIAGRDASTLPKKAAAQ